ncbi:peptidoglycan recognition family protein [Anaeroselena agilis]|uniref:Peptidoglycan recognition family protein n=1 Tax=Anaeroselena agilis TaxID=3063788 RepID=A0ABU3NYK2_9FIRM|nr:peptidoglycan recognition family protein [Selenomonadales bacterium 4137-cl]
MFKAIIALLILFTVASPAAAAPIGMSRDAAEKLYGGFRLVEDGGGRIWTRDEWDARPPGTPPAAEYGYLTAIGGKPAAAWLTYDRDNRLSHMTVILEQPVSFRDLGRYHPSINKVISDAEFGSQTFIIRAYPRDVLAAVVPQQYGDLLVTFLPGDKKDATKLNTHSRVRGFTIARLTIAEKERMLVADEDTTRTVRDGSWRRVENFLRPGLHFSEKLVARRRTDMIVIHHTKIENMTVASIHDLHLRNGWAGIGYHKVILPDGAIADGRPEYAIGAHALGVNSHSVGISLVGDFDVSLPSPAQLSSLISLTAQLAAKYGVSPARVVGHRDVYAGTTCPGRIFPWAEFKRELAAKMRNR